MASLGLSGYLAAQSGTSAKQMASIQAYKSMLMGYYPAFEQPTPKEPAPEGRPIWVSSRYSVYKGERYQLYRNEGWVVVRGWKDAPSRTTLASSILDARAREPRANAKDMFGMLLGVRFFRVGPDLFLHSPVRLTRWESSQLHAGQWQEDDALRGACGIHAAWPPKSFRVAPKIDHESTESLVVGEVRGFGKFVTGKEGWRAEKCAIDRIFLPTDVWVRKSHRKQLEKHYPEVAFEEEPWTLERSSKSER